MSRGRFLCLTVFQRHYCFGIPVFACRKADLFQKLNGMVPVCERKNYRTEPVRFLISHGDTCLAQNYARFQFIQHE